MCSKHPFEPCYGCCTRIPTGSTPQSQPNTQEFPAPLSIGSLWRRKDPTAKRVRIVAIRPSTYTSGTFVHYEVQGVSGRASGQCKVSLWYQNFVPVFGGDRVEIIPGDSSALDARALEALAEEPRLPGNGRRDPHKLRAAEIFDVKPSEVTAAMRRVGKAANFLDTYTHRKSGA